MGPRGNVHTPVLHCLIVVGVKVPNLFTFTVTVCLCSACLVRKTVTSLL